MTCTYHRSFPFTYQEHCLQQCIAAICSALWIPMGRSRVRLSCRTAGRLSVFCLRTSQQDAWWIRVLNKSSPFEGRAPNSTCHPAVTPTYMRIIIVLSLSKRAAAQTQYTEFVSLFYSSIFFGKFLLFIQNLVLSFSLLAWSKLILKNVDLIIHVDCGRAL